MAPALEMRDEAVPKLDFEVESAAPLPYAASPALGLGLRVTNAPESPAVHSILLDTQVRIAPRRRSYVDGEEECLADLFGRQEQWAESLQSFLWANLSTYVPRVESSTMVEMVLPCSYDFEVKATRYLASLEDGEVPLELLFSGTILYSGGQAGLRIGRVPLDLEARYQLPVRVWRETMDHHFPGSAWLRLDRDSFEALHSFRAQRVLPSWEATIRSLLEEAGE